MFVDELTIYAKAGDGGDGVVRWRQEKYKPKAGPSGGDGGRGADVCVRAVADLNQLSKYTGNKTFIAENGGAGMKDSLTGKNGETLFIDVPVGSKVTDIERKRVVELMEVGQTERILKGGGGGLGNEHFKSSTNQSPTQSTKGHAGEFGNFLIEVALVVDIGLVGLPNAGKSTLLNRLTNAQSRIGAYPFTTLEPHLGDMYGLILADIPGLIMGAAEGKGLGHKFLRHVSRTKMLLHLVALDAEDPIADYHTILKELSDYDAGLIEKEQWIILTKKDLVLPEKVSYVQTALEKNNSRVMVVGQDDAESYKILRDTLVSRLR